MTESAFETLETFFLSRPGVMISVVCGAFGGICPPWKPFLEVFILLIEVENGARYLEFLVVECPHLKYSLMDE